MSVETELKLAVPAAQVARVLAHAALKVGARGRLSRERLLTIYYDTPDFDLWRAKASVRLRRARSGWLQTAKWAGEASGGLHRRNEVEQAVAGQALELDGLEARPGLEVLADSRVRRKLKPIFVTEFERALRSLTLPDGSQIEAGLDRGRIVCGTAVHPICELELELAAGSPLGLFDVADALVRELSLRPLHRSKAERGYLLAGLGHRPAKARRVDIDPAADLARAAAAIIGSGLAQAQANEDGMLAGEDIEYLHQMRVGVRRLRSCLGALRDALPPEALGPLAAELKWLGGRLGRARDWDVFVAEALPPLASGLQGVADAAALEALDAEARRLGAAAGRSARAAWRSKRTSLLLLGLGRAAAGGGFVAQHASFRQATVPYSAALLGRRLERVLRLGRKARKRPSVERLHALRIAVKKLRYAVEFFGGLHGDGTAAQFRERLVDLQDCLGIICDAAGMVVRVREAAPRSGALLDNVAGWSACIVQAQRACFDRHWKRFRRSPPFW